MMLKKIALVCMAGALCSSVMAEKRSAAGSVAAPFGLTIGVSTCKEAESALGGRGVPDSDDNSVVVVSAAAPSELYPGAKSIKAYCGRDSLIVFITLESSKGGVGNAGTQQAYKSLSKYKLVEGGPMPAVGSGYALFKDAKNNVIELAAPHMSFEFSVNYMTPAVYDGFLKAAQANKAAKAKKQDSL